MARRRAAPTPVLAAAAWAVACAVAEPAWSQPAAAVVAPDRPDSCTGIQVIPPGHLEVEAGATLTRVAGSTDFDVGELMIRVPLSTRVEARAQVLTLDWGWARGSAHGLLGPLVDVKWKLADGETTDFGVVVGTSLPIGSASERSAHLEPYGILALDQQLTGRLGVTLNAGVAATGADGTTSPLFSGGASFSWQASPAASLFLEGYAWLRSRAGTPAEELVDGGLQLLVGDRLMLDARVGVTFASGSRGALGGIGASVLF